MKKVVQDLTSAGIDWQREKWQSGLGSKFIHQGEKNAAKYADEVIVLSKGVQDYFKETYGRKTHFIPNGVNRPQIREASLITDKFGLKKDSYILFLGRLVPEKGIRYLVEAFKNPLKGKVYCGYCQKLMKYRVLKKLGPSFNCRFSATAVDSPCKRIPISEKLLEEIVRNALTVQIKQAEHILEILHERERKALICFSALERQEEKLSEEKAEIVKQRVALYEQYADGNMSKEEFIRQRDAYRVQEDEKMEQIQRLRTEKNQIFQPVKKDTDNLQAVMDTVGGAGDVMHLSQNVVETFIDRIEVFNDESVKIRFTFEDVLAGYAE